MRGVVTVLRVSENFIGFLIEARLNPPSEGAAHKLDQGRMRLFPFRLRSQSNAPQCVRLAQPTAVHHLYDFCLSDPLLGRGKKEQKAFTSIWDRFLMDFDNWNFAAEERRGRGAVQQSGYLLKSSFSNSHLFTLRHPRLCRNVIQEIIDSAPLATKTNICRRAYRSRGYKSRSLEKEGAKSKLWG